jgi:carbamate kinase
LLRTDLGCSRGIILDFSAIEALVESGHVVIAGGGGGIPVVKRESVYAGIAAVIDKDYTAALIARQLGAQELIDLTNVDYVYRGFGTPDALPLRALEEAEARALLDAGEFPPGNMGPKITAALSFLMDGGESVLITSMAGLEGALRGEIGTRIRRTRLRGRE